MTIYDPISTALNLTPIVIIDNLIEGMDYFQSSGGMCDTMKEHARKITLEQFNNPEMKKHHLESCISHSDKIWINDGVKNKRILENELANYPNFIRGRLIPKTCRFGNYDKSNENNPFYNKTHSDKTKEKISKSKMGNVPGNYGKKMKWITNGKNETQIEINIKTPDGWHNGRLKRGIK
jgi:hypothetical protein